MLIISYATESIRTDGCNHAPRSDLDTVKCQRNGQAKGVNIVHEVGLIATILVFVPATEVIVVGTSPEGSNAHVVGELVGQSDARHIIRKHLGLLHSEGGEIHALETHANLELGVGHHPVDVSTTHFNDPLVGTKSATRVGIAPSSVADFKEHSTGEILGGHSVQLQAQTLLGFELVFRQGLACLATGALNHAAGPYGDAAIAGMSIVTRVAMFVGAAMVGLGQGFQPVCAFAYGAGQWRRVYEGFAFLARTGALFLATVAAVCWVWAPEVVGLFRGGDAAVQAVGVPALRWQMATLALSAWIVPCNMMMQAIRKPVRASLLAASRQGLFFIPAVIVLPRLFGLAGVEASQAVADVLAALLALPLTLPTLRALRR